MKVGRMFIPLQKWQQNHYIVVYPTQKCILPLIKVEITKIDEF